MNVQIYSTHYMKQYLMKCLLKYITFLKKKKKTRKAYCKHQFVYTREQLGYHIDRCSLRYQKTLLALNMEISKFLHYYFKIQNSIETSIFLLHY